MVDDLGLSFDSTYYVRRALKKFVDEEMREGDLVAIIRTSAGMGSLQQFTADKRILYEAIERVRWNLLGRGGVSAFAALGSDLGERAKMLMGRNPRGRGPSHAIDIPPPETFTVTRRVVLARCVGSFLYPVYASGPLSARPPSP